MIFWVTEVLGGAAGMDDNVLANCAEWVVIVNANTKAEEVCWGAGKRSGCLAGRVAAETIYVVPVTLYGCLVDWLVEC